MSQGIFPRRIRVAVTVLIRLCANAEIGVPREDLHFSGATRARTAISALTVASLYIFRLYRIMQIRQI